MASFKTCRSPQQQPTPQQCTAKPVGGSRQGVCKGVAISLAVRLNHMQHWLLRPTTACTAHREMRCSPGRSRLEQPHHRHVLHSHSLAQEGGMVCVWGGGGGRGGQAEHIRQHSPWLSTIGCSGRLLHPLLTSFASRNERADQSSQHAAMYCHAFAGPSKY